MAPEAHSRVQQGHPGTDRAPDVRAVREPARWTTDTFLSFLFFFPLPPKNVVLKTEPERPGINSPRGPDASCPRTASGSHIYGESTFSDNKLFFEGNH